MTNKPVNNIISYMPPAPVKNNNMSDLKLLKNKMFSYANSNNNYKPKKFKELKNIRNNQIAYKFCNDYIDNSITKTGFCKENKIGLNALNTALAGIGMNPNMRRKKSSRNEAQPVVTSRNEAQPVVTSRNESDKKIKNKKAGSTINAKKDSEDDEEIEDKKLQETLQKYGKSSGPFDKVDLSVLNK